MEARSQTQTMQTTCINTLDERGVWTSWEKESEELFGYRPSEMVGKRFFTALHRGGEDGRRLLDVALREGTIAKEVTLLSKAGAEHHAQLILTRLVDERGTIYGFLHAVLQTQPEVANTEG